MTLFAATPGIIPWILNLVLLLTGLFLIALILIQRGKGGGLTGALGGMGGSSAFGSRAGDAFTKITLYTTGVWLLLIMILIKMVQPVYDPTRPLDVAPAPIETPADGN